MKNTTIATLFITVLSLTSLFTKAEYYGSESSTTDRFYPGYREGEDRIQSGNLSGRTFNEEAARQQRLRETTEGMRRRAIEGEQMDRTQGMR